VPARAVLTGPDGPTAFVSKVERRGRALYLRGESSSKREINAIVGELDVPASTVTCAGCHGRRGEGKTEGGVTAGNLTWSNLLKPYGHTHPSGRKHGAFDEKLFIRSLVEGKDPAGNELAVAMPRFVMSPEDIANFGHGVDISLFLSSSWPYIRTSTAFHTIAGSYRSSRCWSR